MSVVECTAFDTIGLEKRAAAQKAEADFFALLKESGLAKAGADWKEVKKHLYNDPRYDAVGSSSLREELFKTFLKAQSSSATALESVAQKVEVEDTLSEDNQNEAEREREKRQRKERAVREREERVKSEKHKLEAAINRSKMGLTMEEGEREFRCARCFQ